MNFLEELVAEWYEYRGYFCRTNIRFGRTRHGGHIGEMDVVAYHPKAKEFVHIECSTDAWSWEKKRKVFQRKFKNAEKYYEKEFPFEKGKIQKIAITGFSYPRYNAVSKMNFGSGIEVQLIPNYVAFISSTLSRIDPWYHAINEVYPLLRAIQYGTFYLKRFENLKKPRRIN